MSARGIAVDTPVEEQLEASADDPLAAARDSIRLLVPYVRPYRRDLVLLFLGICVETAFNAWLPLSFSYLIDDALVPRDGKVL
ncbi:MAG TPA: hypothetical protein VLJ76_07940, partial [Gaiellaceae bacterium]|nr:hypothetical protein [Gaiellaceae bacterium]